MFGSRTGHASCTPSVTSAGASIPTFLCLAFSIRGSRSCRIHIGCPRIRATRCVCRCCGPCCSTSPRCRRPPTPDQGVRRTSLCVPHIRRTSHPAPGMALRHIFLPAPRPALLIDHPRRPPLSSNLTCPPPPFTYLVGASYRRCSLPRLASDSLAAA
ncbi:hypothetical protein GGX14DRAFT_580621 [Mycena pura]|uniref:Uncharacterized protein n=1 Tax=Mycena pura TaxID=153505 RepID=A0AAD6XXJ3_9AGAR|nr:hypothetical protein GGX14DRAFT_580621 [Mycena pura]